MADLSLEAFHRVCVHVFYIVIRTMSMQGGGGLLFSGGRKWEGTSPYGDPSWHWTTERIVSVLFPPCCSSHWISSHRERKRASSVPTTCCCFCNSGGNISAFHWLLFTYSELVCWCCHSPGIHRKTLGRKLRGTERPFLKKRPLWTISGYWEKTRKLYVLFTDH